MDKDLIEKIEEQIISQQKTVDYDTKDFTIQLINQKYLEGLEKEENEIFVPEYQREFVWDEVRQSRLIESLLLGLPIPSIFLADGKDGRMEIVDGSQRIRTMAAFYKDELVLTGLEKLTLLNGLKFSDLAESRKKKFNNTSLRIIVLAENATEEVKNDLFDRINRGSDNLRSMEKRKGIYRGIFTDFIYNDCAKEKLLIDNLVLSKVVEKRQEREELILRFFALSDEYENKYRSFENGVSNTLDEYIKEKNLTIKSESNELKDKKNNFLSMLKYVNDCLPMGFSRKQNQPVSRVYFEAVAVGVSLALKENPNLRREKIDVLKAWFSDNDFCSNVIGRARTHSPKKILGRVDFVKNWLLKNEQ